MVKTKSKRVCPVCGTALAGASGVCPVCVLRGALEPKSDSISAGVSPELRFEHYRVLQNDDGTPIELGHGAMGVTYKAFDVLLQRSAALKIINAQLIGDDSARHRFLREARAAASVRHPNVASVFQLGEAGGNYFYAMEFVEGETLEKIIQRSGPLKTDLALEVVTQVTAGLAAIHKQALVHRDIKPGNIMVGLEDGRLETVKIIDLGLAKGVAEESSISTAGSFIGTPGYASPEQFGGIGTDIRSDLYSLGITLWEMLTSKLPFEGSAADLMYQHQHTAPPIEKLKAVPAPVVALLEVLMEKDPSQRFQDPTALQKALTRVKEALVTGSRLTTSDLQATADQPAKRASRRTRSKPVGRWLILSTGCAVALVIGWWFVAGNHGFSSNQRSTDSTLGEKSIAVLPFESLSDNKSDTYFADGVHDEILNNLAKIAQLKVISRTSVMQYRPDVKRDLRQIANALGVANVLEGTVRRDENHVRVSTELIDAHSDKTIWADTFDRELTNIFAIQSEIAQTIASKLTATLSPEEKKRIEAKPTENLEAYDLYLRARELIANTSATTIVGNIANRLGEAIPLLDEAVQLDPQFALAYCALAEAQAEAYHFTGNPDLRALADKAMNSALQLKGDIPEIHLTYAEYLYWVHRDYERARVQLAIALRGLPNDARALALAGYMDRRQGHLEEAIQHLNESITRDPHNAPAIADLGNTFFIARQPRMAEQVYDRLIERMPDIPMLRIQQGYFIARQRGDTTSLRSALAAIPASMDNDRAALCWRIRFALDSHDWQQAKQLIEKLPNGDDDGNFAWAGMPVPVGCYAILLARLQAGELNANPVFVQTRKQLTDEVRKAPANAMLLGKLGLVDAFFGDNEMAIREAERAVEMVPISEDAVVGPEVALNLAMVYAWTNELDRAFQVLAPLAKTPNGLYYGDLKLNVCLKPLRQDPRCQKLLAELAPKD